MSEKITLICLPFAGGNRYSYKMFQSFLPDSFEMVCLEYPGRGARFNEPLLFNAEEITEDCLDQILEYIQKPYAIFGHSMGGLIAYLLCLRIREMKFRMPIHLFITGTSGPSANSRRGGRKHTLGKIEFLEEIKSMNPHQERTVEYKELLDFFEPVLRSDFKASETFKYSKCQLLRIPITVITGEEEKMSLEDIRTWQNEFFNPVHFESLPGGHFFIFDHPDYIVNKIITQITEKINTYDPI